MRLNVKHKQSLTKTDKQKKANAEKKSKGPKICKNYNDTSPFKTDNAEIDLTKLRYGMITSCDVKAAILNDGVIRLKDSWTELIIIMLDNLISNNPDNFIDMLSTYEITNQLFVVDKVYGKYTFDKEQYKVYKIFNSGYYLEAIFSYDIVFKAIIGLSKALNIPLDEMKLHLINKENKEQLLNFSNINSEEIIVDINGVQDILEQGMHMVSMNMLEVKSNVHRLDVALIVLCRWILDNYGENVLLSLNKCNNTGICKTEDASGMYTPIANSNVSVYTDLNTADIIKFIKTSLDKLDIGYESLRFKFRRIKVEKELKEWEIG